MPDPQGDGLLPRSELPCRLTEAGVPVATTRFDGTMHDFVMVSPVAASEPALARAN